MKLKYARSGYLLEQQHNVLCAIVKPAAASGSKDNAIAVLVISTFADFLFYRIFGVTQRLHNLMCR